MSVKPEIVVSILIFVFYFINLLLTKPLPEFFFIYFLVFKN